MISVNSVESITQDSAIFKIPQIPRIYPTENIFYPSESEKSTIKKQWRDHKRTHKEACIDPNLNTVAEASNENTFDTSSSTQSINSSMESCYFSNDSNTTVKIDIDDKEDQFDHEEESRTPRAVNTILNSEDYSSNRPVNNFNQTKCKPEALVLSTLSVNRDAINNSEVKQSPNESTIIDLSDEEMSPHPKSEKRLSIPNSSRHLEIPEVVIVPSSDGPNQLDAPENSPSEPDDMHLGSFTFRYDDNTVPISTSRSVTGIGLTEVESHHPTTLSDNKQSNSSDKPPIKTTHCFSVNVQDISDDNSEASDVKSQQIQDVKSPTSLSQEVSPPLPSLSESPPPVIHHPNRFRFNFNMGPRASLAAPPQPSANRRKSSITALALDKIKSIFHRSDSNARRESAVSSISGSISRRNSSVVHDPGMDDLDDLTTGVPGDSEKPMHLKLGDILFCFKGDEYYATLVPRNWYALIATILVVLSFVGIVIAIIVKMTNET